MAKGSVAAAAAAATPALNRALSPNRQVSATRFQGSAGVATPTPDGGASSRTAGPIIQQNWERMRDQGMSAQAATAALHTLTPTIAPVPPVGGSTSWWMSGQPANSDPHQATMSGPVIPAGVRAPDPTWQPGPGLGSNIVNNLTHWSQPPTTPTNSYGPAGQILNRYVVEQA